MGGRRFAKGDYARETPSGLPSQGELKREVSIFKRPLRARCTSAALRNTPSYPPTPEDKRNEEHSPQRSLYDRCLNG